MKEWERAKSTLHSAFSQSSPAEQDQLIYMQDQLQSFTETNLESY
ncbi:DUF3813 domain-containing protein [Alkalihalobacillus sp. MEB130]|nr:DUF3813 domain-containing protein [Alkalihalobacillus sp. MEB130]MDT8859604.1 DUF3813 domain-containing protein [Alkalihalobacillus sp. MEB130]